MLSVSETDQDEHETRGQLSTAEGRKEFLVVRRGVLRIFQGPQKARGPATNSVLLAFRCEVKAQKGALEIRAQFPHESEYVFNAGGKNEAEAWRDEVLKSASESQKRSRARWEFLQQGCTAYKYNYSNSKRMRRHFWIVEENVELCWGKSRNDEPQTMALTDCVGIIYGPLTTTFQQAKRCNALEDAPWCCFSLLFKDRTLDLAVSPEHIGKWFLGLQDLLFVRSASIQSTLSEPNFVFRKVFYKLRDSAHRQGFTTLVSLARQIHAFAKDKDFREALKQQTINGSRAKNAYAADDAEADAKAEKRKKKKELKAAEGDTTETSVGTSRKSKKASENGVSAVNGLSATEHQEEELQKLVAKLELHLDNQTTRLEALRPKWSEQLGSAMPMDGLQEVLRSEDKVEWQLEKCTEIEREVLTLKCGNGTMNQQLQTMEKAEKSLKKLAKQFKESEAKCAEMEQDLSAAQSGPQSSEKAKLSSKDELERAEAQTSHLDKRVKELQQQLKESETGSQEVTERMKAKNKQQVEELRKLEKEKGDLQKKLDGLSKDIKSAEKRHQDNEKRLAASEGLSRNLVASLQKKKEEVVRLRESQKQVKSECDTSLRYIADRFPVLKGGIDNMMGEHDNLNERMVEINQERKKLHNLVLELKGNIRVFVRVRPMFDKEKIKESSEPTITFEEDQKLSVYKEEEARRKWFEFDKCFQPDCNQTQVFEEVKPLATSVLDGYNVCIFAYGQTGSGKTFTMSGNKQNPGLNTKTLTELFRIADERKLEVETRMKIVICEIYNEQIKDLLADKKDARKLDVKQNPDGTNSVPGLTERECHSVEDVLKSMDDASANRSVTATDMNDESSRSHSIVQVKTVVLHHKDKKEFCGKINLIDLAGSENTNKSGVTGQGMKEAQNINKSLSALGDVISSLVSKNGHIPYRNSKLTMMLKDSLGGDSKTLMIVQTSPAQTNVTETLSSLNFASRARNVELGKAKKNVKSSE